MSEDTSARPPGCADPANEPAARILSAAMGLFIEHGYAATSTLEIARRAKVSKRDLYALFGSKQGILAAAIAHRSGRMRLPEEPPPARSGQELASILTRFGTVFLGEVCHPHVLAVFRLAIAEAQRAPEVARTLDSAGREASRAALRRILDQARGAQLLDGDLGEMTARFFALLVSDHLMVSLLLGLRAPPAPDEIEQRARSAADALLGLHGRHG